jgi:hypothetical protein
MIGQAEGWSSKLLRSKWYYSMTHYHMLEEHLLSDHGLQQFVSPRLRVRGVETLNGDGEMYL